MKRGAANLLGGRALRFELHGLISRELRPKFDLTRLLNHGYLPSIYFDENPKLLLESYVSDYLQEEVAQEGLIRNLPAFSSFLTSVSLTDTEFVNYANIASDCGVSAPAVKEYYQILIDTMLGAYLPAFQPRAKRKVKHSPKFYLPDIGVVNYLARRGRLEAGSELFGKAFENWLFHELTTYNSYSKAIADISFYRLNREHEVDFVINVIEIAIEAKASAKINSRHLKANNPLVKRTICISLDLLPRETDDGIEILPASEFANQL